MTHNITKEQLIEDLKKLGVQPGDLLNVKCSLRSVGRIEGGAKTLITALLEVVGEKGTIVTDSFINVYKKLVAEQKPVSTPLSPSYAGALANAMIGYDNSRRSTHPIQKFVAIGALADELTSNHTSESYAYDVLRVMSEREGKNLKIGSDDKVVGVGTTHVAVGKLGFKQKRPVAGVYYEENGKKEFFERTWAGICSQGLKNFIPLYENAGNIIHRGSVGNAEAKISSMQGTLDTELTVLQQDSTFFMCHDANCLECRLNWEMSKETVFTVLFKAVIRLQLRLILKVIRSLLPKRKYYNSTIK